MTSRAAGRLFGALLVELASGNYAEGARFLSHRRIMRQWRVAADTANGALALLRGADVLRVRDRSGHYLPEGFRERAFLALHRTADLATETTPLQQHGVGMKILLKEREGAQPTRVAAILVLQGDRRLRNEDCDALLAICEASSLTARGIFLEAEEHGVGVDFFLCDGSEKSVRRTLARVVHSEPDGVMIITRKTSSWTRTLWESLLKRAIPTVVLFGDCEGSGNLVSVNFNNVGMGFNAAETFLRNGHRRLGAISILNPNTNSVDRLRGFHLRTDEERGVVVTDFHLERLPGEYVKVVDALRHKRITAVFSLGEELLAGLLPVLSKSGINVPEELSLIMCSSSSEGRALLRPVDTLILDFLALGRMAFRALVGYCTGRVAQKVYLLDPVLESQGTVIGVSRRVRYPSGRSI